MHPQYRFIPLRSFVCFPLHFIPLQALSFSSLHSSSIMSDALSFFSGCSFAQPSGLAPLSLCPKSRNAYRLTLIFSPPFHARSTTLHFAIATFRSRPAVAVRLPQHRHFAPRKKNISANATIIFFLRCLGVFDCRLYHKIPKKYKQE